MTVVVKSYGVLPAKSLPIPAKVQFAGQTIDLTRYDMRERFDREQIVIAYQHSSSILMVKRANRYFPIVEPILKQYGIPDDFKYLMVIESMLDPRAVSPAQAAGLWQFLAKTGQDFGLEVSAEVDERYHIEKSTIAACKYIRNAYNRYNSWTTAAISYNAGMARISDELEKQMVTDGFDLLLVSETSRYMFRILAMKRFLQNPRSFGFRISKDDYYHHIPTRKIVVRESIPDLAAWAKQYNITYAQLKDFNIWLRDRKLTVAAGKEYVIEVPENADLYFDESKIKVHNFNNIDNFLTEN